MADGYTVIVDDRITGRHAFEAFQGFGETDFQVVVAVGYNAEIVIVRQLGCIRNAADNVDPFVQFLLNDTPRITAVLHAVIQGCHFFVRAVRFLVCDTGRRRTGRTVHAGLAVTSNGDICCYAVLTVDTDFAVFTVFTRSDDGFGFKVFIHLHVDGRITACILRDKRFKVFSAVVRIGARAFPFHGYLGAQFICLHTACVGIELQTFGDYIVQFGFGGDILNRNGFFLACMVFIFYG